jgi:glyoxylase-like metal-dependent hydrolase (beta-lactamase superfamily II)
MTPLTLAVCNLVLASGCGAAFPAVPAASVQRTERAAREVELCVLYQERFTRPLWTGVQASGAPWDYTIASILIRHPAGPVVVDPAFGRSIAADLGRAGPLVQLTLGTARGKRPLVDVLEEAGIAPTDISYALVTHAHWDHTGALGDLPNAKVLVSQGEVEWVTPFIRFLEAGGMPHHFKRAKARLFTFPWNGPAVDGFPHSFDVFGDGAVVAVPLPGHTPGSTGYLVRGPRGRTYFLIGDTTWTSRGVEVPAHKSLPLDVDREALTQTLARVHAMAEARRDELVVLPAHDATALSALPTCGPVH